MAKWGWREHKWEGYTNVMLVIGSLSAVVYWYIRDERILWFLAGWTILTTLVHTVARIFHRLEKFFYRGRRR